MSNGATRFLNQVSFTAGTTSTAIEVVNGNKILGLYWGTDAANATITFQAATAIGGPYTNVQFDGADVTAAITNAGGNTAIDPVRLAHVRFVRLSSSATQTATITLATMDMC